MLFLMHFPFELKSQSARLLIYCPFLGELDPERMGSGIQYGDAALRQLRSPRRAQPQGAQECGC